MIAVTDEVYEHLVFDGREHVPLATLPGMAERTLTISSAGKTFCVTGWKIGWVIGPPELVAAVRAVKQFLTFVSGAPFQPADRARARAARRVLRAFRAEPAGQARPALRRARRGGFTVFHPAGHVLRHRRHPAARRGSDGRAFCLELPERAGVVAVPTVVFYDDEEAGRPLVRFAFCKRDEVIDEAAARLALAA